MHFHGSGFGLRALALSVSFPPPAVLKLELQVFFKGKHLLQAAYLDFHVSVKGSSRNL